MIEQKAMACGNLQGTHRGLNPGPTQYCASRTSLAGNVKEHAGVLTLVQHNAVPAEPRIRKTFRVHCHEPLKSEQYPH